MLVVLFIGAGGLGTGIYLPSIEVQLSAGSNPQLLHAKSCTVGGVSECVFLDGSCSKEKYHTGSG